MIKQEEFERLSENAMLKIQEYIKSDKTQDILELADFMATFYRYSLHNSFLIKSQWSGALAVGSYKFWNDLGYKVKEKSKIRILVPISYTLFEKNGKSKLLSKASKEEKEQIKKGVLKSWTKKSFKQGAVFDITQTDCPIEDYPKIFPNRHYNLKSDPDTRKRIQKGINLISNELNCSILKDRNNTLGNAKGAFFIEENIILLNPHNNPTEKLATEIHELTHATLHKKSSYTRVQKEFQAELTSYIICKHFGIDTSEKAVPYIAAWLKNEDKIQNKMTLMNEIQRVCKHFIIKIESYNN